ncbi:MAG: Ig-like domain-containing protein [Oscillospiraceae bacterium]|nr:Ig-like domain-containing protein [Oscillospiraceae bacterium]
MTAAKDGGKIVLTWRSSDDDILSISDKGMLSALRAGTAELTAVTQSGKSATIEVHVRED